MCSTSSPGPNCFPVFVWFVFLGTFSSHSVQNLPPGSLWLVMTNSFSRMQQKQSLVFFFSPFPLRIDACVHSLIRMYWFHSLGQRSEVGASMAKKKLWFWDGFGSLLWLRSIILAVRWNKKQNTFTMQAFLKNKNKKTRGGKKGFTMSLSRFHTEQHISDDWWFNSKVKTDKQQQQQQRQYV